MQDKVITIGKILNLSSTETRQNTVCSMIESILYSYGEPLDLPSIITLIQDIFKISPNQHELNNAINFQLESNHLTSNNGKVTLSNEKHLELQSLDIKSKEEQQNRFLRFKQLINSEQKLDDSKINKLWLIFNDYILETFYQYGESAVNHFRLSNIDYDVRETSPFKNALEKLASDEKNIFKNIVIEFTNSLTSHDIEYLDSLANKTVSFHSLGLPNDLHLEIIDKDILNWVIFVDTNFLFSILNLHKHPENEAANELIKLASLSKLQMDFRYTPFTIRELKGQKTEFSLIPRERFTNSQISAMLRSKKLDSFSEAYYESLLNNSEATLHPTLVIDHSERTLQVKKITKYNSDFAKITEEHLNQCIGEYQHYINILNSTYQERNLTKFISKSEMQLHHDVYLREAILFLQGASKTNPENLSQKKYFGLTLDKLLIKYDKYELSKQSNSHILPNFYLPSFLLKKLYQILPIETQDYKKAFVTAIATFTFFESPEKSRDVQKFVAYYRNMGLEDEETLLSLITDEFFLSGFFKENIDQDDFVESELNKRLRATQQENNLLKSEMLQIERSERSTKEKIDNLQEEIDHLKNVEQVYLSSLKKVQQKRDEEHKYGPVEQTIFEQIKRDEEVKKLENEVSRLKKYEDKYNKTKKEDYVNKKMKKWRLDGWVSLFISLAILFTFLTIIHFKNEWNSKASFKYIWDVAKEYPLVSLITTIGTIWFEKFLVSMFYDRHYNKSHIKAARDLFSAEYNDES